jgi:glycosyltransferase involved in cell wall biosynthesis
MPTFNRAATIERAIRSIFAQTLVPEEIIVSDDASTDNTVEIAERLGVTVVRNTVNQGSGPTRNAAIAAGTQPWIALLDSDDEWLPNHMQTVWASTRSWSFISASGASVRDGRVERILGSPTEGSMRLTSPVDVLVPENPIVTSSVLIRRSVLDAAGRFRPLRRAQDLDLWIRILQDTEGVVLPDVTVRYHRGDAQAINDIELMAQNRSEILSSYATASWNSKTLFTRTMAARRWDAMRAQLRAGNRSAAFTEAAWIMKHPASYRALAKMLRNRRDTRNRTATYVVDIRDGTGTVLSERLLRGQRPAS